MYIEESSRALFEALSLLKPWDIDKRKVRWGSGADGGYIFAEGISNTQPVLSLGIGWNCDLDFEFAERGHPVAMYDPTIESTPRDHENFLFSRQGVAGTDSADGVYLSLESMLRKQGWWGRNDVILKMDVEGAELDALVTTSQNTMMHFEQIVMELHWLTHLTNVAFRKKYIAALSTLIENFTIFHVHANNCASVQIVGGAILEDFEPIGGLPVVDVIELSLIRTDRIKRSESATFYPTPLDYPNHALRTDHILCFYPFLPSIPSVHSAMAAATEINDLRYNLTRRR
jgi:hypothetical protein